MTERYILLVVGQGDTKQAANPLSLHPERSEGCERVNTPAPNTEISLMDTYTNCPLMEAWRNGQLSNGEALQVVQDWMAEITRAVLHAEWAEAEAMARQLPADHGIVND